MEVSTTPAGFHRTENGKPLWETVMGHTGSCGAYCPFCHVLEGVSYENRCETDSAKRKLTVEQTVNVDEEATSADKEARWACVICQVYSLLTFHLALTTAVTSFLYWMPVTQAWILRTENHWLLFIAASFLYSAIVASSFGQLFHFKMKVVPALLLPLALGEGYVSTFAMSIFQSVTVLISVCLLIGIYLLSTLYSFQSQIDLTKKLIYLSVATIMIIFTGVLSTLMHVFTDNYVVYVGFATICIILTLTWIVTDTQLLQGDKAYNVSEGDASFMSIQISTEKLNSTVAEALSKFALLRKECNCEAEENYKRNFARAEVFEESSPMLLSQEW